MAAVRSEAAKCPNVKQVVADRRGRPAEVDLGREQHGGAGRRRARPSSRISVKSQLPSLQAATDAGVKVVPWAADPGGKAGKDFVAYVDWDSTRRWHRLGRVDRQGAERQGQHRLPRRPGRQPGERGRSSRAIVEGFSKFPEHQDADRRQRLAGHELGSGASRRSDDARCLPSTRRSMASSTTATASRRSWRASRAYPGRQGKPLVPIGHARSQRPRVRFDKQKAEQCATSRSARSRRATGSAAWRRARRSPRRRGWRTTSRARYRAAVLRGHRSAARSRSATRQAADAYFSRRARTRQADQEYGKTVQ